LLLLSFCAVSLLQHQYESWRKRNFRTTDRYVKFLKKTGYQVEIMLVGVIHDPDTKVHTCKIEKEII